MKQNAKLYKNMYFIECILVYLPDPNLSASCWNNVPVPDAVVVSSSSSVVVVVDVVVTDSSAFLQGTGADVVLMLNLFINPIPIRGGRVVTSEQSGRSELSRDDDDDDDDDNVVICSVLGEDGGCKVVITSFPSLKESAEPASTLIELSTSSSSPPWMPTMLPWVLVGPLSMSILLLLLLSMLLSCSQPSKLEIAAATLPSYVFSNEVLLL